MGEEKKPRGLTTHYIPTQSWLSSRNPVGKKSILTWYETEKKALEIRRQRPVNRKIETEIVEVDSVRDEKGKAIKETVVASHGIEEFILKLHKLSEQDFQVYSRLLEKRFEKLKKDHNEKLRKLKHDRTGESSSE